MLCSARGNTVRRCGVEQQHRRFLASLGVRQFLMTDASMAPQHFRMSAISVGPWSRRFDPKLLPRGCVLCFGFLNREETTLLDAAFPCHLVSLGVVVVGHSAILLVVKTGGYTEQALRPLKTRETKETREANGMGYQVCQVPKSAEW